MAKKWRVISEEYFNYLLEKCNLKNNSSVSAQSLAESVPEFTTPKTVDFLNYVAVRNKSRATALMDLLEKTSLQVNSDGTVVIDGKHIENSHIVDLLNFAVSPGFQKKVQIPGSDEFLKLVRSANVPKGLLSSAFISRINAIEAQTPWIKRTLF